MLASIGSLPPTGVLAVVILTSTCFAQAEPATKACPSGHLVCRHGYCRVTTTGNETCACADWFYGDKCQSIFLSKPAYKIDVRYVSFTWDDTSTFDLSGYRTVTYIRDYLGVPQLKYQDARFVNSSLVVSGLVPEGVLQVVCLVDSGLLAGKNATQLVNSVLLPETHAYCVTVMTGYEGLGPYALAAIGIAVAMGLVLLGAFIIKGELASFSKLVLMTPKQETHDITIQWFLWLGPCTPTLVSVLFRPLSSCPLI